MPVSLCTVTKHLKNLSGLSEQLFILLHLVGSDWQECRPHGTSTSQASTVSHVLTQHWTKQATWSSPDSKDGEGAPSLDGTLQPARAWVQGEEDFVATFTIYHSTISKVEHTPTDGAERDIL